MRVNLLNNARFLFVLLKYSIFQCKKESSIMGELIYTLMEASVCNLLVERMSPLKTVY